MTEQVWWYATRAAGMMTWATATASVVFGLLLSTRAVRSRTGPWFLDLHRFLGGISVVFLIAHMATLWADGYVDFGPRELFVPGASTWRPEAIAWGIIAAYLLVAVEVSSLLRARLHRSVWRAIHFTSFAAMIGGSYHAYLAGSDVTNPVTWVIAGIGSLLVFGLISLRLQRKDPDDDGSGQPIHDQRSILEEMRKRLEELPIPESTPQPQISASPPGALPRRAPVADTIPRMPAPAAEAPDDSIGFDNDPFTAVPLPDREPQLGEWADPSPADPFRAGASEPLPQRVTPGDDGADLFQDSFPQQPEGDPFQQLGVAPPPADPLTDIAPITQPTPGTDLFAAATPSEKPVEMIGNPFDPVDPTPIAIREPAPSNVAGPPPLPDAVDPVTGEPDQAAYSAWLKDWLAYAEQYGDEAPEDPNRV